MARVASGDCDCGQERGEGMSWDPMDSMTPEELAALLADNIAPESYDALVAMVAAAIDAAPDEEHQAFWESVCALLTQ